MRYLFSSILFCFFGTTLFAQTIGGNPVFSFLQLPFSAQQSALGGINITTNSTDVANAWANPALLSDAQDKQFSSSYNSFLAGINQYGFMGASHLKNKPTTLAAGIHYIDYGTIQQTDAVGNSFGFFRASDYAMQIMASTKYLQYFQLGGAVKFIQSNYGQFRSNAVAVDIGLNFTDTVNRFRAALVVKNIGFQLRTYTNNTSREEVPFDMQVGITKWFDAIPLELSITAYQVHRLQSLSNFILSARYNINEYMDVNMGYNFLRARDLFVNNGANGFNGFNGGLGIMFRKMAVRYSTGFYQKNLFHHFSVNLSL